MLQERYAAMNLFELIPALNMEMEPVLAKLDELLDDDRLFQAVKADLAQRYPQTLYNGRPSTPVEVVLRMLVIKHLYGWSYAQTERWVNDSLVLRQFCRVYLERVPDDTTLIRWANQIQPATLHQLLDHVVDLARQLKVTRARKLRIDGTVVESNIHHPSDSTLLTDGVRVLSRTLKCARQVVQEVKEEARDLFRDRTRSATHRMKQIMHTARQRGEAAAERMVQAYEALLDIAQASVAQAEQVVAVLVEQGDQTAQQVAQTLRHYLPLVEQVIEQTTRRVLAGESVPASEKIVSLFEPHSAIIRKGKPGTPVQFGRVLWLDELDGGIISRYEVLEGNPPEPPQLPRSLDHHQTRFGAAPTLVAGDRGLYSPDNERYATQQGVKYVVLPKAGRNSQARQQHERQRWFRRGRNWRAGIEGRISVLKRRHKLRRCRYHGSEGMERWVGWGIITHNLHQIARATVA